MKARTILWGLAGGLLGMTVGLFVVLVRAFDPPPNSAETGLPARGPDGFVGTLAPPARYSAPDATEDPNPVEVYEDAEYQKETFRSILTMYYESGRVDKAVELIKLLGHDRTVSSPLYEDENLQWLATSLVGYPYGSAKWLEIRQELAGAEPSEQGDDVDDLEGKIRIGPGPVRKQGAGRDKEMDGDESPVPADGARQSEKPMPEVASAEGASGSGRRRDFARAEQIAAMIRSPWIRASTILVIGKSREKEAGSGMEKEAANDYEVASAALSELATKPLNDSRSRLASFDMRWAVVWVVGTGLIGMMFCGFGAQALNALGSRIHQGMADEIDREVTSRVKKSTA